MGWKLLEPWLRSSRGFLHGRGARFSVTEADEVSSRTCRVVSFATTSATVVCVVRHPSAMHVCLREHRGEERVAGHSRDFNRYGYYHAPSVLDRARLLGYHREVHMACSQKNIVSTHDRVGLMRPATLPLRLRGSPEGDLHVSLLDPRISTVTIMVTFTPRLCCTGQGSASKLTS